MLALILIAGFALAFSPFLLLALAFVVHTVRTLPVSPLYAVTRAWCWLGLCTHEYCTWQREKEMGHREQQS